MAVINEENFYCVHGWMIQSLNLKGTELHTYAIIYGFTQDSKTEFTGGLKYLCEWVGVSKPTIIKALSSLTQKGLIIKTTVNVNGVTYVKYKVSRDAIETFRRGGKEILPPVKNLNGGGKETLLGVVKNLNSGGKETLPNNILNNIEDNIVNNIYTPKNDFSAEFDSLWSLYPKKKGKSAVSKKAMKELQKAGFETVKKAIESYKEEIRKNHTDEQYILHGSTFFNGRWKDYISEVSEEDEPYANVGLHL